MIEEFNEEELNENLEEDLNEQGQKFTSFAYDTYLNNLEKILGHKPYVEKYNQKDSQKVAEYLNKLYSDYFDNPPLEPVNKEKHSFFKNLFKKGKD